MHSRRYPKLHIRSNSELAKHISHVKFARSDALALIRDVEKNFETYWRDNKRQSEPEKNKYVRNARTTPLGRLLDHINKKILAPHDRLLPDFIFGGVCGKNHTQAAQHLLGQKRKRTLLKLDITRFFEQIGENRVYHFFQDKGECSHKTAKLLARLCCVPLGPKGATGTHKTIARGFATSSRLAVWCNLDTFLKLDRLVKKRLKGKDPRIAVYVEDIGITASKVSKEEMDSLYGEIQKLFTEGDTNQMLPLNEKKKAIISHEEGPEILGLKMYRNRLAVGAKTKSKIDRTKTSATKEFVPSERKRIKRKHKALVRYKRYVEGKIVSYKNA